MAAMVNPLPEPVGYGKDHDKDPASDSNPITTLFHRRIEFHAARKPFLGFSEGGNSGFKLVTLNPSSSSSSKADPKKACFGSGKASELSLEHNSNGLDPELSFTITCRRIGAGLQNLGNTCFLNSVLQCLTYTEPLAAYLQSGRHKISCRMAGFCALCAIQKHVSRALESTGRILAPKDLVSNLRCISRSFRNARQEDAHEYMVNLLESMHKCCLPSGMPSESPTAYEKSLVHKIFGGRLRSQVKCMQCSFCSNKFDPFLDLSLEIMKADSLYKALAHFTAQEQLDGGERQYQCQQCKQQVRALKQLTIYKPPEVLSIHLKRFGSHVPGQKIDKKIQFGPTLDLKTFVTGPYDGDVKYTLYGVLVHAGWSTHSGHYYCFVRTSSGMWYSLDDNQVVQVSERRVLEQKAYMLFYVRDRTFSVSKKTADTLRKENMAINASGRKVFSNCSQGLKENILNGIVEKKLNDSLSAEAAQKQALNPPVLKEIQIKGDSHLDSNGPTSKVNSNGDGNGPTAKLDSHQDGSGPTAKVDSHKDGNVPKSSFPGKDHPTENSLKVSLAVGLGNGFTSLNFNVEDHAMQTVPSLKGSGSVDFLNSTNEGSSTSNGPTVPGTVQHDCDGLLSFARKNESASVAPPNADNIRGGTAENLPSNANNIRAYTVEYLSNAVDGPSNLNVLRTCPQNPSTSKETNAEKVGGFSNDTGLTDSSVQKADSIEDESCLSGTPKGLLIKKALDDRLHTVKMKPLKRFVTTHKLSKSIIFGAAFGRRKKRHRMEHYSLTKLDGNSYQFDLGPCTSEKSKICSGHYSQKRLKCGSDEKDKILGKRSLTENDDLQKGSKNVDSIGQCGKSLTRSTELNIRSSITLGEKPSEAGKSVDSEHNKSDLVQNSLMSMLTRGIEETTVARWDGVEDPSGGFVESRSEESLRIGYIGDDWDEVYDSGKRKKIRSSKIMFDGTNPFQEIAMKKAKTKKGKLDRYSSSANQPFRI